MWRVGSRGGVEGTGVKRQRGGRKGKRKKEGKQVGWWVRFGEKDEMEGKRKGG